jgi:hypothetical protein
LTSRTNFFLKLLPRRCRYPHLEVIMKSEHGSPIASSTTVAATPAATSAPPLATRPTTAPYVPDLDTRDGTPRQEQLSRVPAEIAASRLHPLDACRITATCAGSSCAGCPAEIERLGCPAQTSKIPVKGRSHSAAPCFPRPPRPPEAEAAIGSRNLEWRLGTWPRHLHRHDQAQIL